MSADLPTFTPANSLANEGDLVGKIVKEGKVDEDALAALKAKGNAELSATADFIAGKFEFDHGNIAQSRPYFESALRFQPDNSTILIYYSASAGADRQCRPGAHLRPARRSLWPDSADAYTMLGTPNLPPTTPKTRLPRGSARSNSVRILKVQQLLAKAQREQNGRIKLLAGREQPFCAAL